MTSNSYLFDIHTVCFQHEEIVRNGKILHKKIQVFEASDRGVVRYKLAGIDLDYYKKTTIKLICDV